MIAMTNRFILFFLLISGFATTAVAQTNPVRKDLTFVVRKSPDQETQRFVFQSARPTAVEDISAYLESMCDTMPLFPGGEDAMQDFIQDNLQKPDCPGGCREGIVTVVCVIDTAGNILEARPAKSLHPLLDGEAVRVVRAFPGFSPGFLNGQKVRVYRYIKVPFYNEE